MGNVRISEFVASNGSSLLDGDDNSPDWIDLHNMTGQTVSLNGWKLTDDASELNMWTFVNGITIEPDGYLVVCASGQEVDDYVDSLGYYHTNFSLDIDGEYLALVRPDGTIASEYAEYDNNGQFGFPPQVRDISYGLYNNEKRYFGTYTPNANNSDAYLGLVADTKFSNDRGFYDTSFDVVITCETDGANIRYTTDGSAPTEFSNGADYSGPINITTTTCLRAAAFKTGWMQSDVDTQSYIFPVDVINQPGNPTGFPSSWGGTPADYEMASDVVVNVNDLNAISTISVVTSIADMFGSSGIYANPESEGVMWERPCSLELNNPDGSEGFQVNCGIRVAGGGGRRPEYRKHGFRALFKSIYGPSKLQYKLFPDTDVDSFDTIVFKCGTDISWVDPRADLRQRALFNRDRWSHNTERDMGQPTTHGRFVHFYVNGLYWGIYDMMERPDASYMAQYFGGDKENYDSINQSEVIDGDSSAWNAAIALANSGGSRGYDDAWYAEMQQWVDVNNLCDFILNQFYNQNIDWSGGFTGNNWRVASVQIRDESGNPIGASFKSFIWDAEHTLADGYLSSDPYWDAVAAFSNHDGQPARLFGTLINNTEFLMRFADRAHKHLFNDGALSVESATERFNISCNEINRAVVAESARWGDRRETPSLTRDEWIVERDRLLTTFFPYRTGILLGHLKNHSLYPTTDAPVFSRHGGKVTDPFMLTITNPNGTGTIYYTTDGSDPRGDNPIEPPDENTVTLIAENADKSALVPSVANGGNLLGTTWTGGSEPFTETGWTTGSGGVGYENSSGYGGYIGINVGPDMYNINGSCFIRIPFTLNEELSEIEGMALKMRYDDGWVAYLNGVEVAQVGKPNPLNWNSTTTNDHEAGITFDNYDISAYIGNLQDGSNVLAIHGLNYVTNSSDLIMSTKLDVTLTDPCEPDPPSQPTGAVAYTGPVELRDKSTRVKARVYHSNQWSALCEATFAIGPVVEQLRITEIMYHPRETDNPNMEFIELKNIGPETLNLNLVSFSNGIDFTFGNIELADGQYVTAAKDPNALKARYIADPDFKPAFVFGPYSGRLENTGERIELQDAIGRTIHNFKYEDGWRRFFFNNTGPR